MGSRFFRASRISPYARQKLFLRLRETPTVQSLAPQAVLSPLAVPDRNPNFEIRIRWHVGQSDHHHRQSSDEGDKIFKLGLAGDIGLAVGKAATGYLSGSTAIIADAAHSLSDVVLSSVALLSFKASRVPKDKEHPYGHGKFETLGALGISGVLLATAGGIAWHAFDVLAGMLSTAPDMVNSSMAHQHMHSHGHSRHHHGIDMNHPVLALSMTVVAITVKEGLYWITRRAGERAGSGLMKANAWHHRADAISSVVALVGVGGSILGLKFLDPLAGVVVSGMILKAGLETGYQSVLELVDAAVPSHDLDPIKQTILHVEGVKGCNNLRGRRAGSSIYLDVTIEADLFSSITEAHKVGESVRLQIQTSHPEVSEVFIHLEPSKVHFPPDRKGIEGAEYLKKAEQLEHEKIEEIVSTILSSRFSEKMSVEQIRTDTFQGKMLLQIEVLMPPNISIRDATEAAQEAEKHILQTEPSVNQVRFYLRLGHPREIDRV